MKKIKTMIMPYSMAIFGLLFVSIILTGCANNHDVHNCVLGTDQSGFWAGAWHGTVAEFAIVGEIFSSDIRVYDCNNVGFWYDLGFVLGLGASIKILIYLVSIIANVILSRF